MPVLLSNVTITCHNIEMGAQVSLPNVTIICHNNILGIIIVVTINLF